MFLSENMEFLAAFSWSRYRILGAGVINLTFVNGKIRLSWEQFNKSKCAIVRDMCFRCNFDKEILVSFPDKSIMRVTPALSPPEAFYRIGEQWRDFIRYKSKNFYW